MSIKSEHRRLRQSSRRDTPDSVDTRNSKMTTSNSAHSKITRSQSGNSENTRSQLQISQPSRSSSRELSESTKKNHSERPDIITIEAEVHEDCIPIQPMTRAAEAAKDIDSAHLVEGASKKVQTKPVGGSDSNRNLGLVLENTQHENLSEESRETAQGKGGFTDTNQTSLEIEGNEVVLTQEYRKQLEAAFVTNHLYGNCPQSITEATRTLTLQAQVCL